MGKEKQSLKKKKKLKKKVAQKNLLATFSLKELLAKAQDEIDTFQYKEAQTYCQEALKRDPDNLKALEISASLCVETENFDGAKHCLGRAITLAPESGFSKYLSMGQLMEGKDSLQCFLKGIELLNQAIKESSHHQSESNSKIDEEIDKSQTKPEARKENDEIKSSKEKANLENASDSLVRKLSNAHCAVAELFMSDLCDEEEAETESLSNIEKAIAADPSNPEAYQYFANFLLIKEEFEKAKENIKRSVSLWLPRYQEVEDGEASAGSFDPVDICPLTQSVRFQTARILIEVEEHQLAADVLEGLLGENDEVIYTWYLLGWNHYLQGEDNFLEAKEHFEKAMELHESCPSSDDSIVEHMKDLLKELKDVKDTEEDIRDLEEEIEEMEVS